MSASSPSRRAAWGSLSRDAVVDAALQLMAERGPDSLSIRALAARLEVTPMALYRHVDNREDLLDAVVNRLLAASWRPTRAKRADWQSWAIEAADRLRRLLIEQPTALELYLSRPVVSPVALDRMAALLAVLEDGLGDAARAHDAYAALQTYTIGFAALEAAREAGPGPLPIDPSDDQTTALREIASYTTPDRFRATLRHLLAGLDQHEV